MRQEKVVYQLEDMGDPVLRLRATLRQVDEQGETRYLYRIDAFSRLRGNKLGAAEALARLGTAEAFAADSRQFQSAPFRQVLEGLSLELVERYSAAEAAPSSV